jgi:hypothetical protein
MEKDSNAIQPALPRKPKAIPAWNLMGHDGQPLDEIIIRKEAERRTEGEFWWGFGSTIRFARQREIRPPAKAKACDVCANAAFRISTLHRRCLYDVI